MERLDTLKNSAVLLTAAAHPFKASRDIVPVAEGKTLEQILMEVQPDPFLRQYAVVTINGDRIPRDNWRVVRPKAGTNVGIRVLPQGGGGGGSGQKNILRIVLTVAVLAASFALAGPLGAAIGVSTGVAQGLIGAVGMLLVNVLAPVKPPKQDSSQGEERHFLEGQRNRAAPFEPIPQVLGKVRVLPQLGAQPYTEPIGDNQFLHMILVWGIGPLKIDSSTFKIGETALSSFRAVEIENRQGYATDEPLTLYPNTVVQSAPTAFLNVESGAPSDWVQRTTGDDADSIAIDIQLPRGLYNLNTKTGSSDPDTVNLEVQFRKVGNSTWLKPSFIERTDISDNSSRNTFYPETISTDQDDYGLFLDGSQSVERIALKSSTAVQITGFSTDDDAFASSFEVVNVGNHNITLKHLSANSFAANRMDLGGSDVVLGPNDSIVLEYDNDANNWVEDVDGQIGSPGEIDITRESRSPLLFGYRWETPERAQYEVRVRRTNDGGEEDRVNDTYFATLRSYTNENPIQSSVPLAMTAVRIKATDQLNRVVDEFSGVVTTLGKDWDGANWIDDQPIQNCASLYRHVLQGNAIAVPLADSRIDLPRLEDWHDLNESLGFKFNQWRNFESSVWDVLRDVAGAGRAAPSQVDGKWSVVVEEVKNTPVSHVTPRNSYGFRSEKLFPDLPHAWRIRFQNENEDYRQDERRVYRNGFDSSNATKFESLEFPGVTDPDQIWTLGRFRIAQLLNQPERYTFNQDMEYLTYVRGDRIVVTHDVLLVGLASGRVTSVTVDGSNNVTHVEIDEEVSMDVGSIYGISIRTVGSGQITEQVQIETEPTKTLEFVDPVPAVSGNPAISVGDLFGFGVSGSETDDATVLSINPNNDFQATVIAVPYRAAIFDSDSETIPEFDSNITPITPIPAPTVLGVVSDESALVLGPGQSLQTRVIIQYEPFSDPDLDDPVVEAQIRSSTAGGNFTAASIQERSIGQISIGNVMDGSTVDLRVRFRVSGRLPGAWTYIYNYTIIGKGTPPGGLLGLTISVFGGQAYLRWDEPSELDVVYGGEVRFRHSQLMSGATWSESVSIGQAARARDLFATLPLKSGTYLARVFDAAGNPSTEIAFVTTKQASVLLYAAADTLDEGPSFGGTHDGTNTSSGVLKLEPDGSIDDVNDVDSLPNWDAMGGISSEGTYDFQFGFDFGTVTRLRLTTRVTAESINVLDLIDDRSDPIDSWESFDGDVTSAGDVRIEVRYTDDDPTGSPTWSSWERLDSAEFEARAYDFRALLSSEDPAVNIHITELGVDAEQLA